MTFKRKRIVAGITAAMLSVATLRAQADWMQDFYSSAGAGVNVTAASAISTQSVVGYSGGGVSWRVPQRTLHPFQVTPPSLQASCSGIDLHLGGFSFVNKDAFVNGLRNFGQAAVGYFFELALRSMAPEIMVTLDAINDIANKMNQFGINGCSAAKKMMEPLAEEMKKTSARDATGYARAVGEFTDEIDGLMGMQDPNKLHKDIYVQKYGKEESALTPGDVAQQDPALDVNLVYWAMKHSQLDLSDDEVNLVMSLIGPQYIITSTTAADGSIASVGKGYAATIKFADLVGQSQSSDATFKVYSCNSAICDSPTVSAETHKSFSEIAAATIAEIKAAVATHSSGLVISTESQTVIRLASVPIYRVAALAATPNTAVQQAALAMGSDLADYVGMDAAKQFVDYYLGALDDAVISSKTEMKAPLRELADKLHVRIVEVRKDAQDQVNAMSQSRGKPVEKLAQLEMMERSAYAVLNEQLAANARFQRRQ